MSYTHAQRQALVLTNKHTNTRQFKILAQEVLKQCEAQRLEKGLAPIGVNFGVMSVDIEGLELEVLVNFFRETKYRPRVVLVELFHKNRNRQKDYDAIMRPHGYRMLRRFGTLDGMWVLDVPK